jgi:two-component system NtrC family sensor kinase
LVAGALKLASSQISGRAQVTFDAEAVPAALGDAGQITQVLVNLLVNAAQAFDPHRSTDNRIRLWLHPRQETSQGEGDGRVVVEVSDNGPGIPAALQKRLFEPFFTTKPSGQGTGLGLFISRSIVEAHGGSLTVSSEPGRGTTFKLELPHAVPGEGKAGAQVQGESSSRTKE